MNSQIIIVSALIHNNGKILIAKRADTKNFLPNRWEVPGGHVEFGETPQEALIRELQEELHIDIRVGDPVYCFTYQPKPNRQAIEIDFLATMQDPNQEILLNRQDHGQYLWIVKKQIGDYFSPEDWTGKAVKRGFELLK